MQKVVGRSPIGRSESPCKSQYSVPLDGLDTERTLRAQSIRLRHREALAAFPHGLTTAEVAPAMRPTDLAEEDIASRHLIGLAHDGAVTGEQAGTDVLCRVAKN
jgi:hypothetical protein